MNRFIWLALLLFAGFAWAQPADTSLLQQAQAAAATARNSGELASPDQLLWREVITLAQGARTAAPDDPEIMLFQAHLYSEVSWYSRAWRAWLDHYDATGIAPDAEELSAAAHNLGFSRYQAGDLQGAVDYYLQLLEFDPDNSEALSWVGRIYLEADDPDAALPYITQLQQLAPTDAGVAYQLSLAQAMDQFGAQAADAFFGGAGHYERGETRQALTAFEAALGANPQYFEAAVWAGRTALELGLPDRAARHWATAVQLQPDDTRSHYFLTLARDQITWGTAAASAFHQGQSDYEAGDLAAAHDAFVEAAHGNDAYLQAWSWAARTAQELERLPEAVRYWQEVLDRDPTDEGARYFQRVAEQKLAFGKEASADFLHAVELYQQGSFEQAEQGFLQAVQANPRFASGWGYLGQLYFGQGRFSEAAEAYEKAAELDPAHANYAFFAAESRRLASSP